MYMEVEVKSEEDYQVWLSDQIETRKQKCKYGTPSQRELFIKIYI